MYSDGQVASYKDDGATDFSPGIDSWADVDGDNWGLEALNVPVAWDRKAEFAPVRVGVYDAGFEEHHPDLIFDDVLDNIVDDGTKDTREDIAHGTHVSGIIAAGHNNKEGISGVATDTRLYACTNQKSNTGCSMADKYAYARLIGSHIKVINVSLGLITPIQYAASQGDADAQKFIKEGAGIMGEFFHKLLASGYDFVIVTSAGNANSQSKENRLAQVPKDADARYGYRMYDDQNDPGKGISPIHQMIPHTLKNILERATDFYTLSPGERVCKALFRVKCRFIQNSTAKFNTQIAFST